MKVSLDTGDLTSLKLVLSGIKNGVPKVASRAINKTLTGVVTDADREIRKNLNLKSKRVKQDFSKSRATWSKLNGGVYAKGKPVNLATFIGTRQTLKGISVQVKKSSPRKIIKHGFLWSRTSKLTGEAVTAFWRKGYTPPAATYKKGFPYAKLPDRYRFPLVTLTGPRVEDEYAKPQVLGQVQKLADQRYLKNLDSELSYELRKFA